MILEDVQSRADSRGIALDRVGVSDLRYPITVLDREGGKRETVATLSMSVDLPHHFKGTHMSRFVEILNEHRGEVTLRTMPSLLEDLKQREHNFSDRPDNANRRPEETIIEVEAVEVSPAGVRSGEEA